MTYSFTINIDVVKILKFYLIGCIVAYFIVLFFEIDTLKSYLKKNNYTFKEIKKKYYLFFNLRYLQGVPMSWILVLFFIFALLGNFNSKLSKRYFWWIRLKDILRFVKKEETLYFYCNNKYFGKVKNKLFDEKYDKKIVYRILRNEIKNINYSDESWKNYVKDLTINNYKSYFDIEKRDDLKSYYERLVFKRFCKYYSRKII